MSKFENRLARGSALSKNKGIMIKICNVSFVVLSHSLPRDPEWSKKIWPFEIYLIRMIYKKTNLVVILYKIISYCRIVYHRELSWASRSIAWWYQMNHQGKVMTSLINQDVFGISISLLLDQRHKCYTIRRVFSRGTNQLSMIFFEKLKEMPQNSSNIN